MDSDIFAALHEDEMDKARETLARELPVFRAQIGITQEKLCQTIGITRQTYSLIETRKKPMAQNVFLSLVLLFHYNDSTRDMLERTGVFTDSLKAICNYNGRK